MKPEIRHCAVVSTHSKIVRSREYPAGRCIPAHQFGQRIAQLPGECFDLGAGFRLLPLLVHGRIHYTKWIDSMGNDRYGCEIIAEKVDFLSRPKSAESENPELADKDDEIPF